jgi:hypothetical protein
MALSFINPHSHKQHSARVIAQLGAALKHRATQEYLEAWYRLPVVRLHPDQRVAALPGTISEAPEQCSLDAHTNVRNKTVQHLAYSRRQWIDSYGKNPPQ